MNVFNKVLYKTLTLVLFAVVSTQANSAPSGISVTTSGSNGSITINWTNDSSDNWIGLDRHEEGCSSCYVPLSEFSRNSSGTLTSTFQDSTAEPGKAYAYKVHNGSGGTGYSNYVTAPDSNGGPGGSPGDSIDAPGSSSITQVSVSRSQWSPYIILQWQYEDSQADVYYFDENGSRQSHADYTGRWDNYWFDATLLNSSNSNPADVVIGGNTIAIDAGETLFEFKKSDSDISYAIVDRTIIVNPWSTGGNVSAAIVDTSSNDSPGPDPGEVHYDLPVTDYNNDGQNDWYQLQDTDYNEVCATGAGSCDVLPGTYILTNHSLPGNDGRHRKSIKIGIGEGAVARNTNHDFDHNSGKTIGQLDFNDPVFTQSVNDPSLSSDLIGRESGHNPDDNANFRVLCQWSHFNYDDPILDQNGTAHLHMYFGNTAADANTSSDKNSSHFIAGSGGGTCSGFGINRSAYWTPALMKGENQAIVPREIIVYYKTKTVCKEVGLIPPECDTYRNGGSVSPPRVSHRPSEVVEMPQGLQLITGNNDEILTDLNMRMNSTSLTDNSELIFWSCGKSGSISQAFNRIPTDAEWESHDCESDDYLNATIYFPQCWKGDVENDGIDVDDLTSPNGRDHVEQRKIDEACPDGHQRLPQLGYLLYWDLKDLNDSTDGLRLSSDKGQSTLDSNSNLHPGGTLHADWIAGWHDDTMKKWTENCLWPVRNCSFGQTGTSRKLRHQPTNYYNGHADDSVGPANSYLVNIPEGSSRH